MCTCMRRREWRLRCCCRLGGGERRGRRGGLEVVRSGLGGGRVACYTPKCDHGGWVVGSSGGVFGCLGFYMT